MEELRGKGGEDAQVFVLHSLCALRARKVWKDLLLHCGITLAKS